MFRPSLTLYYYYYYYYCHFDFVATVKCVKIVIDNVNAQTRHVTMLTASECKT